MHKSKTIPYQTKIVDLVLDTFIRKTWKTKTNPKPGFTKMNSKEIRETCVEYRHTWSSIFLVCGMPKKI